MSDPLIQHLVRLASRPDTATRCSFDQTELDRHLDGGYSCPTCGNDSHRTSEWMPSLKATRPDQPYPFIYHPPSGWLAWGQQNGLHDEISNSLHQQGMRVPQDAVFGRFYPTLKSDRSPLVNDVHVYDQSWKSIPPVEQQRHLDAIRSRSPQPEEASATEHWASLPDKEEVEWTPSIPSLDEVARPSPERYFKWLQHPDLGTRIWEVDGPDGEPWHAHELNRWLREHGAAGLGMGDETTRGYGVANHNGGVVHNYGSGYKNDLLPGMATEFQEQYPDIPWRPYVPTEPLEG